LAPIRPDDVENQAQAIHEEWKSYELWEKVEVRERRNRRGWIVLTGLLFLILSAIPVILEQGPRWKSLSLARQVASELNRVRRDAALLHEPMNVRLVFDEWMTIQVSRVKSCQDEAPASLYRQERLDPRAQAKFRWADSEIAQKFGLEKMVQSLCFDPIRGWSIEGQEPVGIAIFPVRDLAEMREDRAAVVWVSGIDQSISFF
jgi:hypothetical protein